MKLNLEYQQELSKTKQGTIESSSVHIITIKKPKLFISKFNGTPQD